MNTVERIVKTANETKAIGALHEMHKCLKAAVHAVHKAMTQAGPNMVPDVQAKAQIMVTRLNGALEIAERTFPDPMSGTTDTGRNDGPVALVQPTDGGGGRLFVHGVLVRSVGFNEVVAIRRVADMINEAAEDGQ